VVIDVLVSGKELVSKFPMQSPSAALVAGGERDGKGAAGGFKT
jgi:hypothetical protein